MPLYYATGIDELDPVDEPLPVEPIFDTAQQTVFILHTSGSTSGMPKLVPCSARWMDTNIRKSWHIGRTLNTTGQDVCVWV